MDLTNSAFDSARMHTDFGALTGLRGKAQGQSPEAARAVAKQFEALFVQNMVQSMRQASSVGGVFDTPQTRLYQDLFDKQIALDIAERGDLGFADMLIEEIAPQTDKPLAPLALANFEPRWWQGIRGEEWQTIRQLESAERLASAIGEVDGKDTEAVDELSATTPGKSLSSPEEFVKALLPHAETAGKKLGLSPDLLLAQAALETGWGQRMIRGRGGVNSHNLFGIKAGSSWAGEKIRVSTLEYENGVARRQISPFRAYDSYADSFNDYVDFLQSRPRYARALENANNPGDYIRGLQDAGYATDPRYADKVLDIMHNRLPALKTATSEHGTDNG
jgi:flagellar protein FlgJ